MVAILNLAILDSAILVFSFKVTHTCQDWFPPFAQKHFTPFYLTQLDDSSHLEFCHLEFGHLGYSHLGISSQCHSHLPRLVPTICSKTLHSFYLTQLDDGSHLEFCHVGLRHCHPGFIHLVIISQIDTEPLSLHSDSDSNKFNLTQTHSFWLNLMMAAILTSTMLDSDTAILDSDTLLSFLRLTQKHSHSTLTLTQTNSIWLKLIHSHLTWWLQPSWIWSPWIWISWILPS